MMRHRHSCGGCFASVNRDLTLGRCLYRHDVSSLTVHYTMSLWTESMCIFDVSRSFNFILALRQFPKPFLAKRLSALNLYALQVSFILPVLSEKQKSKTHFHIIVEIPVKTNLHGCRDSSNAASMLNPQRATLLSAVSGLSLFPF